MALSSPPETPTPRPMGDALSRLVPGDSAHAGAGLVLCDHGESWNTYLLHGGAADSVLVWLYEYGARVRFAFL